MASSKITLIGMNRFDTSLWDGLILPAGVDKDTLVDTIILRGGEFEVLFPDVDFMKLAIGTVSRKWNRTFTKWVDALNLECNPIDNYDRYEEYTDVRSGTARIDGSTHDTTTSSGHIENEGKVSAYDSVEYTPHDKNESNSTNGASSDTTTSSTNKNDETVTHKAHLRGNIGITTSQQMIQSELDISMWNLYEHVADTILSEIVIPVY